MREQLNTLVIGVCKERKADGRLVLVCLALRSVLESSNEAPKAPFLGWSAFNTFIHRRLARVASADILLLCLLRRAVHYSESELLY